MKVDLEQLPKNLVKLTIELSPTELTPHLGAAASRLSKRVEFSGFRPGKAPFSLVKQRLGDAAIYEEAADEIVKKSYVQALLEQKLDAIGHPKVTILKMAPGNPFVYTAEITLMPEIELADCRNLKVRKKESKVEPDGVAKMLEELRRLRAKETRVDRPARTGDKIEIDLNVFQDNIPLESGQANKQQIVIGEKMFIPGFEEQLIGLKAGETKEFILTYPKDHFKKHLAGRQIEFKVTAESVYQIDLPELNDEFARSLGQCQNRGELEAKISENLLEEARVKEQQKFELELLNELVDKSKFGDIPELLVTSQLDQLVSEFQHELEHRQVKFEDYLAGLRKTAEEFREGLKPQAERRIKGALALRAIREKENLTIDEAELNAEIERQKEMYKDDLETYNKIDSPEYHDHQQDIMLNRKVFDFLESLIYPEKE